MRNKSNLPWLDHFLILEHEPLTSKNIKDYETFYYVGEIKIALNVQCVRAPARARVNFSPGRSRWRRHLNLASD